MFKWRNNFKLMAVWRHFTPHFRIMVLAGISTGLLLIVGVMRVTRRPAPLIAPPVDIFVDLGSPVRPMPDKFARDAHMPNRREGDVSGSVKDDGFSAGRDLVYVDDGRVWWESDHDTGDDECDHSMHRAAEIPLRRLIELVSQESATLKLQDAYRASGVHSSRSLHKEGRALDVTCNGMPLERLARLAWAAGFDWVYYEASSKGGPHVHCSVRRDRPHVLALAQSNGTLTARINRTAGAHADTESVE